MFPESRAMDSLQVKLSRGSRIRSRRKEVYGFFSKTVFWGMLRGIGPFAMAVVLLVGFVFFFYFYVVPWVTTH